MNLNVNTMSLSALEHRRLNTLKMKNVTERLSSALRINHGADDPSGLVISRGMKARARGISQAVENAQDGFKMLGVMEGKRSYPHRG